MMIENIEKEVEKRFDEADMNYYGFKYFYKQHLLIVKHFALRFANILNADKNAVSLAATLHDIGLTVDAEDHAIAGMKEAEILMKKYGVDEEIIRKVVYCIEVHDKLELPETLEARIIQVSDAIAHTDSEFLSSMKKIKRDKYDEFLKRKARKINWIFGWNKA